MRPLLPKHILFFFSYSAPARALQACAFSSSPQHWRRVPQEEDSRNVRVSVWWDFKHCSVPADFDAYKVAPAITEALRANGIKGPLHITAIGNVNLLAKSHQEALASTGVNFIHVSDGGKNSVNLLVDLMFWVYENPPPAHLFLISGDKDLAGALHRLRMNNYNILLCSTGKAPVALCSAATIMWQWSSLLKRDSLIGKHFNHPPDGVCDSWYGDSKVPLENLFSAAEKSASLQNKEIYEPSLDLKLDAVPNSVEQQVKHILSLHPKGISMTDLQAELIKCDVHKDRRFYGFKRFSHFLLSIPHVQLQPLEDGNFCVCLVSSKSPEPFESSVVPSTTSVVKNEENEEMGCAATQKLNGEDKSKAIEAHETPSTSPFHERSMDDDSKLFQPAPPQGKTIGEDGKSSFSSLPERHKFKPQTELQNSSPASEKVVDGANEQRLEILLPFQDNKVSKTEMEPLKLRSKKSSHNDIVKPEDASCEIIEKHTASANHSVGNDCTIMENNGIANYDSGNFTAKNKCENPTRKEVDEVCHSLDSLPVSDSLVDERPAGSTESNREGPEFFSWVRSWWPFWKSNGKSDDLAAHQNKGSQLEDSKLSQPDQTVSHFEEPKSSELDQNVCSSGKPELSSVSFWSDMESFIFTPKGSRLVSQSKNREDMANKLQNDGPQFLRSRTKKDIIQLVELLVAEKKWLVESPSKTFPFRLAQPVHKNSLMGQSNGTNGLRSLFLSRKSESNLQKSSEHDVEKHNMSIPDTRVCTTVPETKYNERSGNDILEDCQKLVNEILREHPEGYNICSFRRHFVDKYGYHLDMQKLGHQKLTSLLQTMPGVKLQSTLLFPSVPAVCASSKGKTSILKEINSASNAVSNSDGELSDSAPKESNMESQWEELGPVSVKNSNQSGLESKLSQETIELDTSNHPDYEPIDPGYDSSESEGDRLCVTQPEKEGKPKCNEQDSSLWQALDLWHSSKKWEKGNKKSENVDHLSNSLADILNSSTESTQGTISKIPLENRRQRSQKNYSFVADPVLHDKDGLVDGKLNGFKKAEESKVQS